jgi:hypothetical protein
MALRSSAKSVVHAMRRKNASLAAWDASLFSWDEVLVSNDERNHSPQFGKTAP